MGSEYDSIEFKMVDGSTFTVTRIAGRGREYLNEGFEREWIAIDENTRIRADKVVSITLQTSE